MVDFAAPKLAVRVIIQTMNNTKSIFNAGNTVHIEKLIEMTFNSRDIVNMWPNRKQQHVSYVTKASDLRKLQLRQQKTNCVQTSQFNWWNEKTLVAHKLFTDTLEYSRNRRISPKQFATSTSASGNSHPPLQVSQQAPCQSLSPWRNHTNCHLEN